jgi:hypothetical protein
MEIFWQDLRYSLRTLFKRPGFTFVVVTTLALGIGAKATIFTWIKAVLLASLPGIEQPEKLVEIWGATRNNSALWSSYVDYLDFRDQNKVLSIGAAAGHLFGGFPACWAWRTRASLASAIQSMPSTGKTIHSFMKLPGRGSKRLPVPLATSASTRSFGSFTTNSFFEDIMAKIVPLTLSAPEPKPFPPPILTISIVREGFDDFGEFLVHPVMPRSHSGNHIPRFVQHQ